MASFSCLAFSNYKTYNTKVHAYQDTSTMRSTAAALNGSYSAVTRWGLRTQQYYNKVDINIKCVYLLCQDCTFMCSAFGGCCLRATLPVAKYACFLPCHASAGYTAFSPIICEVRWRLSRQHGSAGPAILCGYSGCR